MGNPAEKTIQTLDDYFSLTEGESETRYEYHFDKIVAMAGATLNHNHISGNIYATIHAQLKGRRCAPFNSDTRLRVADNLWVYPDVMISCNENDLQSRLYINHPSLIIEILSKSTRLADYSIKKQQYFQMPDLQYYILIESEMIFVDVYEKQGDIWINRIYQASDINIPLPLLDLNLNIADLYEWVKFD